LLAQRLDALHIAQVHAQGGQVVTDPVGHMLAQTDQQQPKAKQLATCAPQGDRPVALFAQGQPNDQGHQEIQRAGDEESGSDVQKKHDAPLLNS
jgi:hypothetical protein